MSPNLRAIIQLIQAIGQATLGMDTKSGFSETQAAASLASIWLLAAPPTAYQQLAAYNQALAVA